MKHIVVSGCSFTNNYRINIRDEKDWKTEPIEDWTWAHWLQDSLKETHELHNYGTITNDNKTIARSIIYKVSDLLKQGVDPNDISVVAQWTSLTRNSFFISPDKYQDHNNPFTRHTKYNESPPHTCDYLINNKDKVSAYEHGYFHLTGGYNQTNNPINIDSLIFEWAKDIMSYNERYFEWFEYILLLLNFLEVNGITKIKFFNMSNNFSKNYLNEGKTPPFFNTPSNKTVYQCIIEEKNICNTWEQKDLEFDNGYVKTYADKINFNKYFWFFEENFVSLYGGIIEWSIRNFNTELEKDNLPKVLWRELNYMSIDKQKEHLQKYWYGHTSSILANKFVNDVVLKWDIFN
jgi:hypothetical protein